MVVIISNKISLKQTKILLNKIELQENTHIMSTFTNNFAPLQVVE